MPAATGGIAVTAAEIIGRRKAEVDAAFQQAAQRKQQAEAAAQQATAEIVRLQGAYAELEALEKAMAADASGIADKADGAHTGAQETAP